MKKHILLLLFTLLLCRATALDIQYNTSIFKEPQSGYVEFFMKAIGKTAHFKSLDSLTMQSNLEITLLFKQDEQIVKFDKYVLNSPVFKKQHFETLDFIQVRRYALKNGVYNFVISVKDLNKIENTFEDSTLLSVDFNDNALQISDIQLIERYIASNEADNPAVKNGFYMEERTSNFYEPTQKQLNFYIEIYNSDRIFQEDFAICYAINDTKTDRNATPLMLRFKRLKPEKVNAILLAFNIEELPTGEYDLVIDVRTRTNETVFSKKRTIKRGNPHQNVQLEDYPNTAILGSFVEFLDEKQVSYYLRTIRTKLPQEYRAKLAELNRGNDVLLKKRFLYTFWLTEDHNTPEKAFANHLKLINETNALFSSTLGYGFETDRGDIYLRFGEPNEIITENSDPSAPPYEVWRYNTLDNQQDVKFVFYDPSLAGNNYVLLHSTKRGELNNPNWKTLLYKNDPQKSGNYIDNTEVDNKFGRHVDDIFKDNN